MCLVVHPGKYSEATNPIFAHALLESTFKVIILFLSTTFAGTTTYVSLTLLDFVLTVCPSDLQDFF